MDFDKIRYAIKQIRGVAEALGLTDEEFGWAIDTVKAGLVEPKT
jgi:hypothetical protein